jgi:hypothetical protein
MPSLKRKRVINPRIMIDVTALLAKKILIQLSFRCEEFIAKG